MLDAAFRFLGFAHAAGLPASTAESIDALRALSHCDLFDRESFAAALTSTLAGDREERAKVLTLIELFVAGTDPVAKTEPEIEPFALRRWLEEHPDEPLADALARMTASFKGASRDGEDKRDADELLQQAVRLRELFVTGTRLARSISSSSGAGGSPGGLMPGNAANAVRRRTMALMEQARQGTEAPRVGGVQLERAAALLSSRPVKDLTDGEMDVLQDAVARMAVKLRTAIARRERIRTRGRLDAKKTLALAARTDGVPFVPAMRKKPPHKTQVVVLCDLSRSVRVHARFLFGLLHAMQRRFDRVRTFAFVSKIEEVTRLLKERDVNAAMDRIYDRAAFTLGPASDYGVVFRRFLKHHSDALTRRTTLIVLGDARNNFSPLSANDFAEMTRRARRTIWLNPEEMSRWNQGDSEMARFARHCTDAREVGRLDQLIAFANALGK